MLQQSKLFRVWSGLGLLFLLSACGTPSIAFLSRCPNLSDMIAAETRTPSNVARDVYRHPKATLDFFGLKPDQTVVEIWPGGGWYTEILAPYLHRCGTYYAASFDPEDPDAPVYRTRVHNAFLEKLEAEPELYSRVIVTKLNPPDSTVIAPPERADRVLTFRNVHNWIKDGNAPAVFAAMYAALKPGGKLGVVEHRARPGTPLSAMQTSGYVTEAYVIELAEQAGFKLEAKAEINANPKDSAEHPEGVWTLPPSLRLGKTDMATYLTIGESDRMTLRFVKPK